MRKLELDQHTSTLVGFAIRAGEVVKGFEAVNRSVQNNSIAVIFVDADISDNTMNKVRIISRRKKIPLLQTNQKTDWYRTWGIRSHKILGILKGNIGQNLGNKFKSGV